MSEPLCLECGIYGEVLARDYHADRLTAEPTLSQSLAWLLLTRSPAHAYIRHPRLGGEPEGESSEEMVRGSLIHHLILGGGVEIAELPFSDFRTNEAKARRDEAVASGRTPVLAGKLAEYKAAAEELRYALGCFDKCDTEATVIWRQPATGVLCRARLDGLDLRSSDDAALIPDLKIVGDAGRSSSDSNIERMGYHVQAAAYVEAVATLCPGRRVSFEWRFAEPRPPYAVAEVECSPEHLDLGLREWERACWTWKRCLESDKWPAYERKVSRPTPYAISQDFERQITNMGNSNEELGL